MELVQRFKMRQRRALPYYFSNAFTIAFSRPRDVWSRDRSEDWWQRIVLGTFTQKQWLENFRMSRDTFMELCNELSDIIKPKPNCVREPVSVDRRVGIAIYWLATNSDYRSIGNLFGVGTSTVCKSVHMVCKAIEDHLVSKYITFPQNSDLKKVINGYKDEWGFPNCGGAIDGSHIPIIAPQDAHGDYLNRKGFYSLILQGVCDHRHVFTDVNIGWPGRVHDARVLRNSEIFQKGEITKHLFPDWKKKILPEKEIRMPVVITGDPAYPLRSWLMKPYIGRGNLTPSQRLFNYRLSRTRMTIENSFER